MMTRLNTGPICGDSGGLTIAGKPCQMNVAPGQPLCAHHDPLQAEEIARRRLKGNYSRSILATTAATAAERGVPAMPTTLEDAVIWAAWAMHGVASGTLDARVAHEIGYVCNIFKGALEKKDLLTQIAQLRAELAEARRETPKSALGMHRG